MKYKRCTSMDWRGKNQMKTKEHKRIKKIIIP